jgi:hypothetical protein
MTSPSGTRSTVITQGNYGGYIVYYRRKAKSWQKAPYNLPLPYDYGCGFIAPGGSGFDTIGGPRHQADAMILANYEQRYGDLVVNNAYEKFRSATYDSAGLGVDFVEYRQALGMVTNTLVTLGKFTNAVRKFHFGEAAKLLRMKFIPKNVNLRKSWANNWLEYHFGWEPLVRDIYDSVDVLNNPIKRFSATKGVATAFNESRWSNNLGSITDFGHWRTEYLCKQGGSVKAITSGTSHALDQFGLINPASLVWEVVPFSFVVDWFANVGDVLRSLSDFAGMTLERTYATFIVRSVEFGTNVVNPGFTVAPGVSPVRNYSGYGIYVSRVNHLYSPVFSVKPLRLPSAIRGVTASALLSQFFKSR